MIRPAYLALAGVCLAACPVAAQPGASAPAPAANVQRFTPRDAFALAWAQDVRITPDGRTIAYVRQSTDIMTDSSRPQIWLVDSASGRQTPLGVPDSDSPRWSPDGRRLAYVAKAANGSRQLFVRWMATGASTALTTGPEAPGDPTWAPDGAQIAFTRFVPDQADPIPRPVEKPEGAEWAAPVRIIKRADYRFDGKGYARSGRRQIFLLSSDGGAARQLTRGAVDIGGPLSWTPDRRRLVFAANPAPDKGTDIVETDLFLLNTETLAIRRLTDRTGPDEEAAVSPDGRTIAFTGFDDARKGYQNRRLTLINIDSGSTRVLTADLDRDVHDPVWSRDGRTLYVRYEDRGVMAVARVTLNGGRTLITRDLKAETMDRPHAGGTFSVSEDGTVAFGGNSDARPPEVMVARGKTTRMLTDLNGTLFAGKALATVRALPVSSSADGRAVDAWMLLPPDFDPARRYPTILEIHGGPYSAYGPSWATTYQLYAQSGYVVLFANPRGSTSYGEAFANLIQHDFPSRDYDDLMSAVDAAVAAGVADPGNLFVTGGSGGGLLTTWIVSRSTRFRAAVAQKPVINWISETLSTDIYGFMARYWFRKPPWEDVATYWRQSPISRVGEIVTPTAVIVGEDDIRTPPGEGEQLFNALTLRGVPTMMVRVPGASHGTLADRPSQLVAQTTATIEWFDRYRSP